MKTGKRLDDEWVELIQIAKAIGMTPEEVRLYLRDPEFYIAIFLASQNVVMTQKALETGHNLSS